MIHSPEKESNPQPSLLQSHLCPYPKGPPPRNLLYFNNTNKTVLKHSVTNTIYFPQITEACRSIVRYVSRHFLLNRKTSIRTGATSLIIIYTADVLY